MTVALTELLLAKEERIVLSVYCKQRIVQLYFEQRVSNGYMVKVLAAEGLKVPKKTIGRPSRSTKNMEPFLVFLEVVDISN